MATVTNSTSTTIPEGSPAGRLQRPRENGDLVRYFLSAIDSTDTFTPFPTTGARRQIYDWAIQPVADPDDAASTTTYSTIPVNVGNGEEMKVVFTQATSSAAAYFTFTCTAGSGYCYLYVWAK